MLFLNIPKISCSTCVNYFVIFLKLPWMSFTLVYILLFIPFTFFLMSLSFYKLPSNYCVKLDSKSFIFCNLSPIMLRRAPKSMSMFTIKVFNC